MNYKVVWLETAENELAEIWLSAKDRDAVTEAAARLDRLLALAPLRLGESRSSSVNRIAYYQPLGVEFDVVEDDKRVYVQGEFLVE